MTIANLLGGLKRETAFDIKYIVAATADHKMI